MRIPLEFHGKWLAAALATVVLAQAAFWAVPGPFWDGWIYHLLHERGQRAEFMQQFVANGRPLGGWLLWQAMAIGDALAGPRLVMALSLLVACASIYASLRVRDLLPAPLAALVAGVACTVPATQSVVASTMLQFYVGFGLLFAGLFAFVRADIAAAPAKASLKLAALACAAAAVATAEAPLALLPAYPVLLVAARHRTLDARALARQWRALLLHSLPVAVGAAALAITFFAFPTQGGYTGAHSIGLDARFGILGLPLYGVAVVACSAPALAVLVFLWWRLPRPVQWPWGELATGAAFVLLGLLPYMVSGRLPAILGWGVRMLLFSGLGVGLLLAVLLRTWLGNDPGRLRRAAFATLAATLLALLARVPLWAGRQAEDTAVRMALAELPRQTGVIWIRDTRWSIADPHRNYEWTAIAQQALRRHDLLALPGVLQEAPALAAARESMRREYGLLGSEPLPICQADLTVGGRWYQAPRVSLVPRAGCTHP